MASKNTISNTIFSDSQPSKYIGTNYSFSIIAFAFGLIIGDLAALTFFILQIAGLEYTIGSKFTSYALLGIVIMLGINKYNRLSESRTTFKDKIVFATQIALFAGFTLFTINTLIFFIDANLVFLMYGKETADFVALLAINGLLFLEIMVVGLIFPFIALQYFKSKRDTEH